MIKYTSLLITFFSFSVAFSQTTNYKLNSLDFSRFPYADLYITAVDKNNSPILLTEEDLKNITITHNGISLSPIEIKSVFELKKAGESELYIALVFDNSESMRPRISLLEDAALSFIQGLQTGDFVSVIDFGDGKTTIKVDENKEPIFAKERIRFSNSKQHLAKAVRTPFLTAKTYMYDALLLSQSILNNSEALGKKVIVFFSDGVNIGSVTKSEIVEYYSKHYDIPIYAIDLNAYENPILKTIAKNSGGEYYFVQKPEDLKILYQSISKILQSQYRLTYSIPEDIINQSNYAIKFESRGDKRGSDQRNFQIEGEKIGYYNLLYYEKIGKENSSHYLNYIQSYPVSKYRDNVELSYGNYFLTRNNFGRALGIYNRILRNPLSLAYLQASAQKAELYNRAKLFADAKKEYEKIIKSDDRTSLKPRAMLELAQSYYAEGNYLLALDTYTSIAAEYEGTEYASDALLQSANLSLTMGNFDKAKEDLTTIITEYPESKSNVYAILELSELEFQQGNYPKVISQLEKVESLTSDPDILERTYFKQAETFALQKEFQFSINKYEQIINGSFSEKSKLEAKKMLIPVYITIGTVPIARKTFYSIPITEQSNLLKNEPAKQLAITQQQPVTAAINCTYVENPPTANHKISVIENRELREKYSLIGPIYEFSGINYSINASISIDPQWLTEKLLDDKSAGVYHYSENKWEMITQNLDEQNLAYNFECNKPGLYAILEKAPRVITLFNIYFDYNKANIKKEAEKNLYRIIDDLKYEATVDVEIAGHTDSTGNDDRNIELSLQRAESIKRFMVLQGIDEERLKTRGYGSQYPIASNDSEENRQKNRRTEFILQDQSMQSTIGSQTENANRYLIKINSYHNPKEAFEQKNFYKKRGFEVSVVTGGNTDERYLLVLGIFNSRQEAESALKNFTNEFGMSHIKIEEF